MLIEGSSGSSVGLVGEALRSSSCGCFFRHARETVGAERVGVELGVLCRTANLAASETRGALSQG